MVTDARVLELARKHLGEPLCANACAEPVYVATSRDLLLFVQAAIAEHEARLLRIGVECVGVGGVRLLERRPVGVVVDPADRAAVIARGAGREGQVLRACIEDGEG